MFGNALGWPHLLIILAVILLLFGATRLPALSRSLGQSIKIFRKEVKDDATTPTGAAKGDGTLKNSATDNDPDADTPPDKK